MKLFKAILGINILLLSCGEQSKQTPGAIEQNQETTVEAWFELPNLEDSDESSSNQRKINAFQLNYKTTGKCKESIDTSKVGAFKNEKKVYMKLDPECDYSLTVALGDSNNLVVDKDDDDDNDNKKLSGEKSYIDSDLNLSKEKPNYNDDVKAIIEKHCLACHNNNKTDGNTNLEGFEKAKNKAERSVARIQNSSRPMPPSGNMPDEDKKIYELWLQQGTPEKEGDKPDGNNNSNTNNPEKALLNKTFYQTATLGLSSKTIKNGIKDGGDSIKISVEDFTLLPEGKTAGFKSNIGN